MKRLWIIPFLWAFSGISSDISSLVFTEKAEVVTGTVNYIYDGDTIRIKSGETYDTVRLLAIDAPEKNEPYSQEAKNFLFSLLGSETTIYIDPSNERDKYDRLLGVVVYQDRVYNNLLLKEGLATRLFMRNNILKFLEWEKGEVLARKNGLGIWTELGKSIIINEIHPNPPSYDTYEFAELYNLTENPTDIGSSTIGYAKAVIPKPTIINPHSFLIICKAPPQEMRDVYNIPNDIPILNLEDFFLLNSYDPPQGLVITLKDASGRILDSLTYNLSWDDSKGSNTGFSLQKVNTKMNNSGESNILGLDDLNWNPGTTTPGRINSVAFIPDITLEKIVDKTKVIQEGTITYTITYKNIGSSSATDVAIIEVLPEKTKLIGIRDSGFGVRYWYNNGWQEEFSDKATKIRWIIPQVAPSESGTVSFTVKVK